jgi:hypothetical protein
MPCKHKDKSFSLEYLQVVSLLWCSIAHKWTIQYTFGVVLGPIEAGADISSVWTESIALIGRRFPIKMVVFHGPSGGNDAAGTLVVERLLPQIIPLNQIS